jgi:hypothetical protein
MFEKIKEMLELNKIKSKAKFEARKELYESEEFKETVKEEEIIKAKGKTKSVKGKNFMQEFDFKSKFDRLSGTTETTNKDRLDKILGKDKKERSAADKIKEMLE